MENQNENIFDVFCCFALEKGKKCDASAFVIRTVEICASGRVCREWFAKFRSGGFNVKHAPRSRGPLEIDETKALVDANHQ